MSETRADKAPSGHVADHTEWIEVMRMQTTYHGTRSTLFWLAVRITVLTAMTLGIYRFWAKTRLRKYIWSSIAADGDSLEYTGTGLEKFLGFLAAIVILAVYLGLLQILLFFVLSLIHI